MADLEVTLATVHERIAKYQRPGIGEQDTKAALIVPVLRALGWDVEDLEEVKLEYRRRPNDNPVDYALFVTRTARLFVEAKALGANLNDPKWANQMLGYAMAAGVEWVALTDGNEYRIYNSHATVPVEQKLFRQVRLTDPGSRPAETLLLLSKAQLADHLIDELWKAHFIDRQILAVLERLFGPDPDRSLVRLIRSQVPALMPGEIRAGLSRLRATFDFPRVPSRAELDSLVPRSASLSQRGDRSAGGNSDRDAPAAKGASSRRVSGQSKADGVLYLMTPVRDNGDVTARDTLESLLGNGVYVFGDRSAGRARLKAGDRICFYWSGLGVVADAEITSTAERRRISFVKDPDRYPWVFSVAGVRFYFDKPVAIDAALRSRLQAFTDRAHDPNGAWAWLVQGTRLVTEHDFSVLTGR